MLKKLQKGFTLLELIIGCAFIFGTCVIGGLVYIGIHFLLRFW